MKTREELFWSKVEKTDTCWLWKGGQKGEGKFYGRWRVDGRLRYAHRCAYEMLVGPVPDGLTLDHICRVHNCVRPDHLEPVTNRENVLRGVGPGALNARKTHCHRGHPFSGSNLIIRKDVPNGRDCVECRRIRTDAQTEKRRIARASLY